MWPAVWTGCAFSWPPEIDVVEAYSDINSKYGKDLQTNIHVGNTGESHYNLGALEHGRIINSDKFIKFSLHWEKDFIKIYYNDYLVRVITDERDLKWFNENPYQVVILNSALISKSGESPLPLSYQNESPMIVEYFKYFKSEK